MSDNGDIVPDDTALRTALWRALHLDARHVSAAMLAARYFANREDGLRPPDNSEELLVAAT